MEPRSIVQSSVQSPPIPEAVADEGPLLLAALAAALVEYRRCVGQVPADSRPEGMGSHWRSIARWDQLRRQA
jgi:hypothetical protein